MRRALPLAALMLIVGCSRTAPDEDMLALRKSDGSMTECKTRADVAGQCFRVQGVLKYREMREYGSDQGARVLRLVSVRPLLVVDESEFFEIDPVDVVVAEARFPRSVRDDVIEARANRRDIDVAGDFEACPLSRERDAASHICVESASNLVVRPARDEGAPTEKKP
jgi:hypothetical protein